MSSLVVPELVLLGHSAIDGDHAGFARLVAELAAADNVVFPSLFAALLEHTVAHFERENALMEQHGVPSIREHRSEHLRVLAELHQFKSRVERGFVQFGRAYVAERLLPWFSQHITTMDSALVVHISKAG